MSEELVVVDDVLMAMADALMEKQPKPFNPILKFQDQQIEFKLGGKPPREIFYRNTVTFLTKLPPPVPNKLCSVQYCCDGNVAMIKCHSCSIYDPSGTAFYCQVCFTACHPWYRVKHIYSTIEKDESIEHTLKIAHRVAEAARYEKEGKDILEKLINEKPKLQYIADDAKVDQQLRVYGRKAIALEEYIMNIRKQLHHDIQQSDRQKSFVGLDFQERVLTRQPTASSIGSLSPIANTPNGKLKIKNQQKFGKQKSQRFLLSERSEREIQAVIRIQKVFRGYLGRRTVSSIMTLRIIRVWSPEEGRDFYYDRITGASSWLPSKLLRIADLDFLEYIHHRVEPNRWICKRIIERRRQGSISTSRAVKILQGFARCCLARKKIIPIANQFYRRVYDEESSSYYYADLKTGDTFWRKPLLYLTNEPPIFNLETESKRSPRVNRVRTAPKSPMFDL